MLLIPAYDSWTSFYSYCYVCHCVSCKTESAIKYIVGLKNLIEEVVITRIMDEKSMKLLPVEKFKEFERIDLVKLEK